MELIVHSGTKTETIELKEKRNLLSVLRENGYSVNARCGGNGTCGKCGVKLLSGTLYGTETGGMYLSCQTEVGENAEIEIFESEGGGLTSAAEKPVETDGEEGYGLALDLGTTTLAFALVHLKTGRIIGKKSCLNPQSAFGADVISRIKAASEGNREILSSCVKKTVNKIMAEFAAEYGVEKIVRLCVAGNTTMLHLLIGADASGIGRAPFTPSFLDTQRYAGADAGIGCEEVVLLPSAHSFVGSDIVCGAHFVRADRSGTCALLDIGTNGEIMLFCDGRILCTSTAAGPAFEGADIECGTGGVKGAIDSVRTENGKIVVTTIGNADPAGICGSGLVDAVAVMLERGIIDETGAFETGSKFVIAGDVYLSQKDIRQFQLAKSAVAAGLCALTARAGKTPDVLMIAGGFGFYLNRESAARVGLIEKDIEKRIDVVGNASLGGAAECLCSSAALQACEKIAAAAQYTDLSTDEVFMEKYPEKMYF